MSLLQGRFYREEYNELIGEYSWHVKPLFAFIVMVPVIWMAMNRRYVGDTEMYINTFMNMPEITSISAAIEYFSTRMKDGGYYTFVALLKTIFGDNFRLYLLTMALIHACSVVFLYRKYTYSIIFPLFLFIASTDYISWMFNGMRQFTAVCIVLMATPFMLKRKIVPAIAIILFASLFHQTALLMIPIFLIAGGESWNKKTMFFIFAVLVAIVFVDRFTGILDFALSDTQYKNVVSDYTAWGDDGTNPIRVLVYSIPALLSFVYRNKIIEESNPIYNFCTNMSIISMGLYLLSMATSGIFIGRLPIYASLYSYILLPWEIDTFFGNNRDFVKNVAILGYIGFYFFAMHFQYRLI